MQKLLFALFNFETNIWIFHFVPLSKPNFNLKACCRQERPAPPLLSKCSITAAPQLLVLKFTASSPSLSSAETSQRLFLQSFVIVSPLDINMASAHSLVLVLVCAVCGPWKYGPWRLLHLYTSEFWILTRMKNLGHKNTVCLTTALFQWALLPDSVKISSVVHAVSQNFPNFLKSVGFLLSVQQQWVIIWLPSFPTLS